MDLSQKNLSLYVFLKDKMSILKDSVNKKWVDLPPGTYDFTDKINNHTVTITIEVKGE